MTKKDKKSFEEFFEYDGDSSKKLEDLLKNLHDRLTDFSKIPFSFDDFLFQIKRNPKLILRDVFQLFHDAIHFYVEENNSTKSNYFEGISEYNTDELLINDCESPFYADRFFAQRFMQIVENVRQGGQINRIYMFEGPPGSGKSTFLNNLLYKIQNYTKLPEGTMLKTVWHLNINKISRKKSDFWDRIEAIAQKYDNKEMLDLITKQKDLTITDDFIDISCPYNDHPILQIPKEFRKSILDLVIDDEDFKKKLYTSQDYAWVFKEEPCHICMSIYDSLYDVLKNPKDILEMLNARIFNYNRRFGYGISIFNPGDEVCKSVIENPIMQNTIHQIFNNDKVQYVFSPLSYTNNGIYALMDIKEKNVQRFKDLHSIVSDGVNKVNVREERIRTMFIGLINPEDKKVFADIKSFQDRIVSVKIPYVLDYNVVMKIQKHRFGDIHKYFMPEVLECFARIIVSTRIEKKTDMLLKLIQQPTDYNFLDKNFLLLKIELLAGNIPQWLTDNEKNQMKDFILNQLNIENTNDGFFGLSERSALSTFHQFFTDYYEEKGYISINDVVSFFNHDVSNEIRDKIPENIIESIESYYDYIVLQQIKECIYFYNRQQITRDILNYFYAINFDLGQEIVCPYTNEKLQLTEDFYKNFEAIFLGTVSTSTQRQEFRKNKQREYVTFTLAQEIKVQNKQITETKQYHDLFIDYTTNLKQNALAPYTNNDNFRNALIDFGKKEFEKYDQRLKNDVLRLIKNLQKKFKYTQKSALQIVQYVFDKKLK